MRFRRRLHINIAAAPTDRLNTPESCVRPCRQRNLTRQGKLNHAGYETAVFCLVSARHNVTPYAELKRKQQKL